MSETGDPSVAPLRVDRECRAHWQQTPDQPRAEALATLLLRHALPEAALAVVAPFPELGALRLAAHHALGPAGAARADRAELAESGCGRVAFEVALGGGSVEAAARIAARTPGEAGRELRAELELRAGRVPSVRAGFSGIEACRVAWVAGDFDGAQRALDAVSVGDAAPEASEVMLLHARLARRRNDRAAAANGVSRAQACAREPRPALALERLLQRLLRPHLWIRDLDQFEALPWALDMPAPHALWFPWSRRVAARLLVLDAAMGPFRGTILSHAHDGTLTPLTSADDVRFRAASLSMGLRVAEPEEVLCAFEALRAGNPASSFVPSYQAEVLPWLGRHAEAGAECERAIALDPSVRWAYLGLAQTQMWAGELAGARATVERVRRRLPDLPTLPAVHGELALLEGHPRDACHHLRRAVRVHPNRLASWLLLARAERLVGNGERARQLVVAMRFSTPGDWPERSSGDDDMAVVDPQLRALRGNRSPSFITLFPEGGSPLLIQGFTMPPGGNPG